MLRLMCAISPAGAISNGDFTTCVQEGVYLGSFVAGSDNRIVSFFGSQKNNGQPVIEFFVNGFLSKPDYLPKDLPIGYTLLQENKPKWLPGVVNSLGGKDILKYLSGRENKIVSWTYICGQTKNGLADFISKHSSIDDNEKKVLEWGFVSSESNSVLSDWLKNSSELVPTNVIYGSKTINLSTLNSEDIPILTQVVIPTGNN